MKYIYFVSYRYCRGNRKGWSNTTVCRSFQIDEMDNICEIEEELRNKGGYEALVVIYYTLLRTEGQEENG